MQDGTPNMCFPTYIEKGNGELHLQRKGKRARLTFRGPVLLRRLLLAHMSMPLDLGCGDFTVGRHLLAQCSEYVGVDVVPDLIDHLRATVQHDHVRFLCLDITSQDLPEGDVCLLRQVLQHLSNAQILKIIPKLYKYQRVYVTEHYPADTKEIVPNRDKIHGADIRLYDNSGVYLDLPPFNLPSSMLELILEVRAGDFGDLYEGGWIRTYMLKPT